MIECYQIYYRELGSRENGKQWRIQPITNFWIFVQQHWMFWNDVLHKTKAKDNLSWIGNLKEAIIYEHSVGLDSLLFMYRTYFILPLLTIFSKPTSYLNQCFFLFFQDKKLLTLIYTLKSSTPTYLYVHGLA